MEPNTFKSWLFDEDCKEKFTIYPQHRDVFLISTRPATRCSHRLLGESRVKPEGGISADVSKEIRDYWGILIPTGSCVYEILLTCTAFRLFSQILIEICFDKLNVLLCFMY